MRRASLIIAAVVGVVLCAALIGWRFFTNFVAAPASTEERKVTIVVPEGAKAHELATLLYDNKLTTNASWFAAYLRNSRTEKALSPGEYELGTVMSPADIITKLQQGSVVTYTVTIEPGLRVETIVDKLVEADLGDREGLLAVARDPAAATSLGVPAEVLDGYLFPDTYALPKGLKPKALLSKLVARYRTQVTDEIREDAEKAGLTEHQLVTLASLIEGDGIPTGERSMLASVYHNRLASKMKLQNPASVAFGLNKTVEDLDKAALDADHPYNTYRIDGLPPGPISAPSLASLIAAARPAKSDALFFAPRGDTTHIFCPDEECYRIALARWRKAEEDKRRAGLR